MTRSSGSAGRRNVCVAPSPLNRVKLELGVVLVATPLVWLVVERSLADPGRQLLALAGYGLAALAWLVARTRAVLARAHNGNDDGTQTQ